MNAISKWRFAMRVGTRAVVMLLVACGGQSGSEDILHPFYSCGEASRSAVALDELSPGFPVTPQDVMDRTRGEWVGTFRSARSERTRASMTVTPGATAELVEWLDADSDHAYLCGDSYEMPAHVRLTEANGLFDFAFDGVLGNYSGEEYPWIRTVYIPVSDLGGSASPPWEVSEEEPTELRVMLGWPPPEEPDAAWTADGDLRWIERREGDDGTGYLGELSLSPAPAE